MGVLENGRHIAQFAARPFIEPLAPTAVTVGFEKCAYPKIVSELQCENPDIRQKAVLAARELLNCPTKHIQCIAQGITPALVRLLQEPELCADAAGTLQYVVTKEVGCRDAIQHGAIAALVGLLTDPDPDVRTACFKALLAASRFECCRNALVQQGTALGVLVQLAAAGGDAAQAAAALQLLNACVQVRHNEAALDQLISRAQAIPALSNLLDGSQAAVVCQGAAMLLAGLCTTHMDAKLQAVEVGCMPRLLELLQGGTAAVATAAASALMNISTAKEAKVALVQAQGMRGLVDALTRAQDEQTRVSILECITNVAELPECRAALQEAGVVTALRQLQAGTGSSLCDKSAAHALRLVNFKNWPN